MLKEFQREDFEGIFEAMDGLPVTVSLLCRVAWVWQKARASSLVE